LRLTRFLYLVLLLCYGKFAFSQPDSIWAVPAEKQMYTLLTWYHSSLADKDSQYVITQLASAEKNFAQKNNQLLRQQAWLLQHVYKAGRNADTEKSAALMLNAAAEAADKKWSLTQAECWHYAGLFHYKDSRYARAFEYMLRAQTVFDRYDAGPEYFYIHSYVNTLGNCYYHFGEYQEAVKYLEKRARLPDYWNSLILAPALCNNLALCYQQLKQYDSAATWFNKAHENAVVLKDSFYIVLSLGNLGYTYYLQHQYDKALPLLKTDYTGSMRLGQTGSAINAAMTLADIHIKKGEPALAEHYMNASRTYVYNSANASLLRNWYQNLYNLSRAKADYKNATRYGDSLLAYKDSLSTIQDKKAFNQALLKLETEKHRNELNQLEERRKQQILLRNCLLAGLVLLTLIALLWFNRQVLKRNKEKELAQQQLQFAEQELISFTRQLNEKNDLLEKLRDEMNQENYHNDREGNIDKLLTSTILTEYDWKKFRQLFEKVYPGFFIRLKEKMPDLNASDIRLLALTKLQLPPKNIASMLGVTYDAVKKARQRLRKKINLPEEGTLEELVEMIASKN
jgi:tetratricopeptide (TPR) repeat protein